MTQQRGHITIGINDLVILQNHFKNQTPSSPTWFVSIDQVVSTLLELEIQRASKELDNE